MKKILSVFLTAITFLLICAACTPKPPTEPDPETTAENAEIQPNPDHIVKRNESNINSLEIEGYGNAHIAYSLSNRSLYIAGGLPIAQLEDRAAEGSARADSGDTDVLYINFMVAQPELNAGAISGPRVEIWYDTKTDEITNSAYTPVEDSDSIIYTFELTEENELELARMLHEAIELCIEYDRLNPIIKAPEG